MGRAVALSPLRTQIRRSMRPARLFLFAAWLCAGPAAAQDASPYVPLEHWAMPYVEQLIAAGAIADPTPLTRPLKRSDLARALQAADTTALSSAARGTMRRLLAEFRGRRPAPSYRMEGRVGAAAATHGFRDPLELGRGIPARQIDKRAFASADLDLQLLFGPVVLVSHPVVDTRLQFDPDWYGRTDNASAFPEAYASAQWRQGEGFYAPVRRKWAPSGIQGVLLSDSPYSLDHLYVTVGTSRLRDQRVATRTHNR